MNRPRLTSLDVLRGLTMLGMIVVNNQGDGQYVLPSLGHAHWHGITVADLVFPFFLVIMGVSMAISFARRRPSLGKVLRRSVLLFALGFFLNAFPHFDPANVHIMGVLQRIALVYLATAVLVLHAPRRAQLTTGAALLVGYFALMTLVPVPGHGAGVLTPDGNLAGWIDRTVLGVRHVYGNGPYDPEGLLSTLPAIVTALIGYLAGDWVRLQGVGSHVTRRLTTAGLALTARRGGVGAAVPDQQEAVDQLLRPVHGRLRTHPAGDHLRGGGGARLACALSSLRGAGAQRHPCVHGV